VKPILLKLAGLQSYREMQEIDFTRLCDAGVFGIFGPTGSGKSSILDAMTLALFGAVERAANGTQGIMNQGENTLSVAFTFELSSAEGSSRYRVERQFKRNGEVSVANTISRIIAVHHDGEEVLADKVKEVTSRVEQLLGLSMHDFTRAVVLPQGKFAEFLSLTGKERRQMLQRLFHLEQYGDILNAKLSQRLKTADVSLKEIAAEQLGLGDASEQALENAVSSLKQAERSAEGAREHLKECERRYETAKEVWEGQERKSQAESELNLLQMKAKHTERLEEQVEKAEQAEAARPYLDRREEAASWLAQASARAVQAEQVDQASRQRLEEARSKYEYAAGELAAKEAGLIVRLNELEQALELEQEIGGMKTALEPLRARLQKLIDELQGLRRQADEQHALYEKAVKKQSDLKEQLMAVEIPADERRKIRQAAQAKQHLTVWGQRTEELRGEISRKETALRELQEELEKGAELRREVEVRLERQLRSAEEEARTLHGAHHELLELCSSISLALERHRQTNAMQETTHAAAELAQHLVPGMPCPVCGSADHPVPAAALSADHKADEDAIERLNSCIQSANELAVELRHMQVSMRHTVSQVVESVPQIVPAEAAAAFQHISEIAAQMVPMSGSELAALRERAAAGIADSEELVAAPAAFYEEKLMAAKAALAERKDTLRGVDTGVKQSLQDISRTVKKLDEIKAKWDALDAVLQDLRDKEKTADANLEHLRTAWRNDFSSLDPDEIDKRMEQLEEAERASEDLRGRLDKSVSFIEETLKQWNRLREHSAERDKEAAQTETDCRGREQLLAEKQRRLLERIGADSAAQLIAGVKIELQQLRDEEKMAKQELEQSRNAVQLSGNERSAALQGRDSANQTLERAESEWKEALRKTRFASDRELLDHLLSAERIVEITQEIRTYRDGEKQIMLKLEQAVQHLRGREVEEQQWLDCRNGLKAAKEADEQAIQARAKAERDTEDLRSKHEKWLELEHKAASLRELHSRLGKLQAVFRGNAFVEYIAEEQLMHVSMAASERLGRLTRQRYAIEVDSGGGFVIRDDANGGLRRPVGTLSGGETFLTSLALALALSAQIQLSGKYPLEFFFLDEGFGTLDQDLLEAVVTALEKLHMDRLTVGVISHVPELRARLPRKLIVEPAEPSGRGSSVRIETI
jgi:exonuclease SbcC